MNGNVSACIGYYSSITSVRSSRSGSCPSKAPVISGIDDNVYD